MRAGRDSCLIMLSGGLFCPELVVVGRDVVEVTIEGLVMVGNGRLVVTVMVEVEVGVAVVI